jgi:hypothetical protein
MRNVPIDITEAIIPMCDLREELRCHFGEPWWQRDVVLHALQYWALHGDIAIRPQWGNTDASVGVTEHFLNQA